MLIYGIIDTYWKNNILQIIMIFTLSVIFSILLFYDAKTELDKLQKSYHNNYSNIITKFLILKNIVIQLFAIIIGAVCSSLGNWDKNQSGFSIKSNILIILGIIYILFVIYSIYNDEKIDSNIKKYVSNIEMLNEIYENVQTSIVCINHAIIKEADKSRIKNQPRTVIVQRLILFNVIHANVYVGNI